MEAAQSAFGLCLFVGFAWVLSENRRACRWQVPTVGIALQLVLAVLLLRVPVITDAIASVGQLVDALQAATAAGTSVVFGYLGGGPLPFEATQPGADFILAFRALPLIVVVSALTALLNHWGILSLIVRAFSVLLQRTLGVSGGVGFAATVNVFVGMVEAPLFVRTELAKMSRHDLFILMVTGMATVAGTVLVLYTTLLSSVIPNAAGHLLVASVISVPAAITVAALMVPKGDSPPDLAEVLTEPALGVDTLPTGAMDAITRGTQSGLSLFLNVVAMLVVLVALVHLFNAFLSVLPSIAGADLSLQRLLGWAFAPVAWAMGIPWAEAGSAGALLGTKVVLNEFLAFLELAGLPPETFAARSRLILTYALCGFANFASLGIMIGGFSVLLPERRADVVGLGMRSLVAGVLATLCTGSVVGIVA